MAAAARGTESGTTPLLLPSPAAACTRVGRTTAARPPPRTRQTACPQDPGPAGATAALRQTALRRHAHACKQRARARTATSRDACKQLPRAPTPTVSPLPDAPPSMQCDTSARTRAPRSDKAASAGAEAGAEEEQEASLTERSTRVRGRWCSCAERGDGHDAHGMFFM